MIYPEEMNVVTQQVCIHQRSQHHYSQEPKGHLESNPTVHGWINKIFNVAYTYNGMLVNLKKNILTHASTWMSLEDIMLSELSQLQKDKYCMVHLNKAEQCLSDLGGEGYRKLMFNG